MEPEIGARIRERREAAGLTQADLASELGVSRGAVGNWELGKGISTDNLAAIAARLGTSIDYIKLGTAGGPAPFPGSNIAGARAPAVLPFVTVPAYGQAVGGEDGHFILNGQKIADVLAPPSLAGIRDAYAVYVSGESMEPRYFSGEAVFVNPHLPIRRDDFVVAQIRGAGSDTPKGYVKRFVRMSESRLVLAQYNPVKELIFPRSQVVSVHRIVMGGQG